MNPPDQIEIRRLRVSAHVGVPDEERAAAQTLWVSVRLFPSRGFAGLGDEIQATIDYHAVAIRIQALAAERPRRLIETLALDVADSLLGGYPLAGVGVTVEKHILPDTECVAVHLERWR